MSSLSGKIPNIVKFSLGFPLTIISFYFIFNYIFDNLGEIYPHIQSFRILPFSVGLILLVIFFLLRFLVWSSLLTREGFAVPQAKSAYLLSVSEIKRFIPGNILAFVSRVRNFNSVQIPARKTIKLIFYESVIFLLSSLIVSIPGAMFFAQKFEKQFIGGYSMWFLVVLVFISVFISIFFSWSDLAKVKRIVIEINKLKYSFFLMLGAWIFFGTGNFLIAASLGYLDARKIIELISLFVFSWLIGYLFFIVPLGLGAREATIALSLSFFVPLPLAATIAILSRIALITAEIVFLFASFLSYRFVKIRTKFNRYSLILWSSILSYIAYFSYVSFEKHLNFFTGRFDLGNMDQTVWNTLHGRIFQLTNPDGANTISRLAIHADFILILLAPFYVIWEDPRMLLLIQAIVLGLGAYFVFKISQVIIKSQSISLAFSISFLLNPWVQKQNLFDFHAVTLATTFLLAAFYFTLRRRYKTFLFFLLLAVLTKENIYLISFIFGIYLAFKTRNKAWLFLSGLSLATFYLLVLRFIPLARGSAHFALEYFEDFGSSPFEVMKNALLRPTLTILKILDPSSLSYLYMLFLPLGFLSFLALPFLFFGLPDLTINLLSSNSNFRSLTFHYAATIIPFVYISAIYGVRVIFNRKIRYLNLRVLAVFVLLFSIYSTFEYGVLPGSKNPSLEIWERFFPQRQEIKAFLDGIPQDLSVAASNNLGAHLSHREKIWIIPSGTYEADVVVLLLNDSYAAPSLEDQIEFANKLRYSPDYIEIFRVGDFVSFAKKDKAFLIPTGYK